jgi:hypothetical protein
VLRLAHARGAERQRLASQWTRILTEGDYLIADAIFHRALPAVVRRPVVGSGMLLQPIRSCLLF